jgi:hypothetical protein
MKFQPILGVLLVAIFLSSTSCAQSLPPEKEAMLKADIIMVDAEIKGAEAVSVN